MVEVTGLDRTGLLCEMTTTLSKLNIASAHVATFGERVVDCEVTCAPIIAVNGLYPDS